LSALKDDVIIYSHPRSGLHLLSLGLYGMTEHFDEKLSYKELWGSEYLPSYDHWFLMGLCGAHRYFKKHILLLRNYNTLDSTGNTLQTDFDMIDGHPAGLEIDGYVRQLRKFEELKDPKMVIYFEDLVIDNDIFIQTADFLEIQYDLKKIDFVSLREYIMRMYKSSGHKPSTKILQTERRKKTLYNYMKEKLPESLFSKYLMRYNH